MAILNKACCVAENYTYPTFPIGPRFVFCGEKTQMKRAFLIAAILFACVFAHAQTPISAGDAINHVGENATVCGQVASTHWAMRSRGNPTFINLDRPYPNQAFTIVIWGSDRPKFGYPEATYSGHRICVSGRISVYRGTAEMIASEPSQIRVQ